LSDRVKQTANGVVTTYTLDLNAGLTQVLADGTNTYLYGLSRVGSSNRVGLRITCRMRWGVCGNWRMPAGV